MEKVIDVMTVDKENEIVEAIKGLFYNSNNESCITVAGVCPSEFIALAESAGAEMLDEWDSNGWQCDFWQPCMFNGRRYIIQGSAYYGTVSIGLDN